MTSSAFDTAAPSMSRMTASEETLLEIMRSVNRRHSGSSTLSRHSTLLMVKLDAEEDLGYAKSLTLQARIKNLIGVAHMVVEDTVHESMLFGQLDRETCYGLDEYQYDKSELPQQTVSVFDGIVGIEEKKLDEPDDNSFEQLQQKRKARKEKRKSMAIGQIDGILLHLDAFLEELEGSPGEFLNGLYSSRDTTLMQSQPTFSVTDQLPAEINPFIAHNPFLSTTKLAKLKNIQRNTPPPSIKKAPSYNGCLGDSLVGNGGQTDFQYSITNGSAAAMISAEKKISPRSNNLLVAQWISSIDPPIIKPLLKRSMSLTNIKIGKFSLYSNPQNTHSILKIQDPLVPKKSKEKKGLHHLMMVIKKKSMSQLSKLGTLFGPKRQPESSAELDLNAESTGIDYFSASGVLPRRFISRNIAPLLAGDKLYRTISNPKNEMLVQTRAARTQSLVFNQTLNLNGARDGQVNLSSSLLKSDASVNDSNSSHERWFRRLSRTNLGEMLARPDSANLFDDYNVNAKIPVHVKVIDDHRVTEFYHVNDQS